MGKRETNKKSIAQARKEFNELLKEKQQLFSDAVRKRYKLKNDIRVVRHYINRRIHVLDGLSKMGILDHDTAMNKMVSMSEIDVLLEDLTKDEDQAGEPVEKG